MLQHWAHSRNRLRGHGREKEVFSILVVISPVRTRDTGNHSIVATRPR